MVALGEVIEGKYRVERILAEGQRGTVALAHHVALGKLVALKFIRPEGQRQEDGLVRFQREARLACRLRSEHAVRVFDVSKSEGGAPYIVMEYLQGKALRDVLLEEKRLPVLRAVSYVLQACEAVAEAHSLGAVHRDLKPANLFLTAGPDGFPLIKVLDFGVSRVSPTDGPRITGSLDVLGSPLYSSPEQILTPNRVDARADIWSLGVILFELTSGQSLFKAPSASETCAAILYDPSPSLRERAPDLDSGFVGVIERCLRKNVEQRFQDVAALTAALAPHAGPDAAALPTKIAGILAQ